MTELLKVQMTSKEVLPLFPTLVWKSQLSPETHEPLNRKILEKLDELTAGEAPLQVGGMWQTDQLFHKAADMEDLEQIFRGTSQGVLDSLKVGYAKFEITGCWANISAPAAPHKMHTHPNNYLSGVYYVKTQPQADAIVFHDPKPQISIISPPPLEVSSATAGKVRVQVDPGTLLVFPSWLQHSVDPNMSADTRVSIAFNIMFSEFTQIMSPPRWEGNLSLQD
jgi:uncharacterized protein (TIGR02466 family)